MKFLISKIITNKIVIGFVSALMIVIFSYLSANLFWRPKPLLKRGYQIAINDIDANQNQEEIKDKITTTKTSKTATTATITNSKTIAEMIKNADLAAGEKIFKKCATCHNLAKGAGNKIGPNLFAVMGRKRASIASFSYSQSMKTKGGIWNYEELNQFLTSPRNYIPGTKMTFAGLKKDQDRANVIAYLEVNSK